MIAIVREELGELARRVGPVLLVELRVPGRVLLPDEHAHFVAQIEELARRQPEAELHAVEAHRFRELDVALPAGAIGHRRESRRIEAPIEHAANDERLAVEQQLAALRFDRAEGGASDDALVRPRSNSTS